MRHRLGSVLASFVLSLLSACSNGPTCDTTAACPGMCLVATQCVTHCGGPEISCGCCPCGPGSIDARTACTTDAR